MAIPYPLKDPYRLTAEEVIQIIRTDRSTGLSQREALKRIKIFGPNSYQTRRQKSWRLILAEQFTGPIVYLLIFGAAISLYFNDMLDAVAIASVILINAFIGFVMELQARSSMNALKKMDVTITRVIRDGQLLIYRQSNWCPEMS
jgi:Ca2+-transporting ATPase